MDEVHIEVRLQKARESSSENALTMLSLDESEEVRCEVASNLNTPRYILERLSTDESPEVRSGIATNPNTHFMTLNNLASDDHHFVRRSLAWFENTHSALLTIPCKSHS